MDTCFVSQPFDNGKYDKLYSEVFEPAIKAAGFSAYRVDRDPAVSDLNAEIEAGIRRARIFFAEITTNNRNVWHEVGFAEALRKDIVLVSEGTEHLAFNIQRRPVIRYTTGPGSDPEEFRRAITERIKALVQKGAGKQKANQQEANQQEANQQGANQQGANNQAKPTQEARLTQQARLTQPPKPTQGSKPAEGQGEPLDLFEHEVAMMGILYAGQIKGQLTFAVENLQEAMIAKGYANIRAQLALEGLKEKRLIEIDKRYSYGDNFIYKLSPRGNKWVKKNRDKLIENKPAGVLLTLATLFRSFGIR